jgi:hypothetical protein
MEAIGEQLGAAFGGNADDAGSRLPRPGRLRAVPAGEGRDLHGPGPRGPLPAVEEQGPRQPALAPTPRTPSTLHELTRELAAAALAAPDVLAGATYLEAADFADGVEELSRTVEYLQLHSAGAVDRTRAQAITDAATTKARTRAGLSGRWVTGWDANGTETLDQPGDVTRPGPVNETDESWPGPGTARPVVSSPADDGCRNTAEFLRLRLRIPIREARRRLTLAHHTLPGTSLTGEPLPPARPHLATALTPAAEPPTGDDGPQSAKVTAPILSSYAATLITATLDRLQHHTTTETLRRIEHHLTTTAATTDPDFLTRLAQRWTDTIDANGTEPSEEALRHTQGAFIRKPRHGLHHLEIFATTDQYEHLLTVMNTATNPRTTTHGSGPGNHTAGTAGLPDPDLPDLDRRTRAQKQLDGLITAAKTALATNTLPTTGGNRPQIIATIHYQDLFPTRSPTNNTPPQTEPAAATATGTGTFVFTGPVAATTLRKIACDADIIPALLGTHGEILDLGRKTRLFSPAQRTALTTRDQGCAFPNCTIPAPWCEAHHITYWSHHGPTTTNNGVLLCSHHHHLIHKEQWTITTTHNTPTFIPPPHIDPTQTPQQNHYFNPHHHPTHGSKDGANVSSAWVGGSPTQETGSTPLPGRAPATSVRLQP